MTKNILALTIAALAFTATAPSAFAGQTTIASVSGAVGVAQTEVHNANQNGEAVVKAPTSSPARAFVSLFDLFSNDAMEQTDEDKFAGVPNISISATGF